jgi:hypothetical protein
MVTFSNSNQISHPSRALLASFSSIACYLKITYPAVFFSLSLACYTSTESSNSSTSVHIPYLSIIGSSVAPSTCTVDFTMPLFCETIGKLTGLEGHCYLSQHDTSSARHESLGVLVKCSHPEISTAGHVWL